MKNKIKLCIGPMSKLVVDSVLELSEKEREKVCFIPSRRQVEFDGGYVNNWTTKEFSGYVKNKVIIQRDHGGPGQGLHDDDGIVSYVSDSGHLDVIHVDPWKKYPNYKEGLYHTITAIQWLYQLNSNLKFEIGSEEAIRKFDPEEFDNLIGDIRANLSEECFGSIRYAVVQSGVGLDLMKMNNTGTYSSSRLKNMLEVCAKYNLLSKEHNGDYLSALDIKKRFNLGLDTINIAPEFGQIQTKTYIENMTDQELKKFYNICYNSGKWKKWVNEQDIKEEKDIIKVCGHYVFSKPEFKKIKPDLSSEIKSKIKNRIKEIINL